MKEINNAFARKLDNFAIEVLKIPSIVLMENAAKNFVACVKDKIKSKDKSIIYSYY